MWARYLAHHGIKGQKWGVRRYQYEDGTRTAAGKKHRLELKSDGKHDIGSKIQKKKQSYDDEYGHTEIEQYKFSSNNNKSSPEMKKKFDSEIEYEDGESWTIDGETFKDGDFTEAEKYDICGYEACQAYLKSGDIKKAYEYLSKELDGLDWEFDMENANTSYHDKKYDDYRSLGFRLVVKGENIGYSTGGDGVDGYTDDQYFFDPKTHDPFKRR